MNVEPKVSCICITHNRLEMFERALQCFLSQTYANKELIVIFENDPVTEAYIRTTKKYNYYILRQGSAPPPFYFIETIENESYPLQEGQKIIIRNALGAVLTFRNDTYQFVNDALPDFNVSIEKFSDHKFLLKHNNHWLNIFDEGLCEITTEDAEAKVYGYTHHLDCTFSLDMSPSRLEQNGTNRVGWEKQLIHEGEIKNVFFYNIYPTSKMSLGMKRNLSIRAAKGDYICVWDDDDWYSADRLHDQMSFLQFTRKQACSLAYTILFDQNTERAYYNAERPTGHENSLLFKKEGAGIYGNLNVQEDTPLLFSFYNKNRLSILENPDLYIYNYHKKNTSSSNHFRKVIKDAIPLDDDYAMKVKAILKQPVHAL